MSKLTYTVRKDGRLVKKVMVNGKSKYLYASNAKDLENKYITVKNSLLNGYMFENEKITFKQWAEQWFDINIKVKEYNTQRNIKILLYNHIYPAFGNIRIKNIKTSTVKKLQSDMLKAGYTNSVNRAISTVKRILNDAVDNDIIQKNVASNIKAIYFPKKENRALTKLEDELLLYVADHHKYGLFYLLLRYAGLRIEEIIPLTVDDVNLTTKEININKAVFFQTNQPLVKSTKNNKNRSIPILDILYNKLEKHIESCISKGQKLLFVRETDSKMLSKTSYRRHLESFLYAINLEYSKRINKELTDDTYIRFTNHQLRHSFCTMLYYSGIGIKEAQALMGHSSSKMVYDVYTHLDTIKSKNICNVLNNYISDEGCQKSCQNKK